MRRDFRVKMDISRIYRDARQYSWVFIDSTKIFYINQLAEHVQKLFDIRKPFHLLSRYDETSFFLPFEEDVRVLENNDTVIIVPGTGILNNLEVQKCESTQKSLQQLHQSAQQTYETSNQTSNSQNGFLVPPTLFKEKDDNESSSLVSNKSSLQNSLQNTLEDTSAISCGTTMYRTALHETVIDDNGDYKMTEDLTENNSFAEDSTVSNKRKRVRKRRQKKPTETVPESDSSLMEISGKKPKIINSIMISSGKHIRFQGLDEEDAASDSNSLNENNNHRVAKNVDIKNKQFIHKDLGSLLSLRQSSTPLTFAHKRVKRDYKTEIINETGTNADITTNSKSIINNGTKSTIESEKNKEYLASNKSLEDNDTVSFKVFRIGEDYTPQLSSVIIAKILAYNSDRSEYTMNILHGKEQLQDPEGKFSLPKDDENQNDETSDVVVLGESKLLELTKVSAIGVSA